MSLVKVFDGRGIKEPLKVAVLFSGSASSMRAMLEDPHHGNEYQITGALTDREGAAGVQLAKDNGIPVAVKTFKGFLETPKGREMKDSGATPWQLREGYDRAIAIYIKENYASDIIALSGWMRILSDPFLKAFPYRCLNVHPADLSIRYRGGDRDGQRCFTGDDAVVDAVIMGGTRLRSTIHFLNSTVDGGPIIVQSGPFEVDAAEMKKIRRKRGLDALAAHARARIQEEMKYACDGPAFTRAMEILYGHLVQVDEETEKVFIDGEELPYHGIRVGENLL